MPYAPLAPWLQTRPSDLVEAARAGAAAGQAKADQISRESIAAGENATRSNIAAQESAGKMAEMANSAREAAASIQAEQQKIDMEKKWHNDEAQRQAKNDQRDFLEKQNRAAASDAYKKIILDQKQNDLNATGKAAAYKVLNPAATNEELMSKFGSNINLSNFTKADKPLTELIHTVIPAVEGKDAVPPFRKLKPWTWRNGAGSPAIPAIPEGYINRRVPVDEDGNPIPTVGAPKSPASVAAGLSAANSQPNGSAAEPFTPLRNVPVGASPQGTSGYVVNVPPLKERVANNHYVTPKGLFLWDGKNWQSPTGMDVSKPITPAPEQDASNTEE